MCLANEVISTIQDKIAFVEGPDFHWSRSLDVIHQREVVRFRQAGLYGPLGTLCAMAQNEWLMTGGSPFDSVMFALKLANSILTLMTIFFVLRGYYLAQIYQDLHLHVHQFRERRKSSRLWLINYTLWVEILVIAVHNPPMYSTSFVSTDMGKNIQVLRSETLMASLNMLRVYLFWRVVRDWMVHDLPKRCTLAGFQRLPIGSTFAVKRMLNSWYAASYLTVLWFVTLFLLAYWYRAVEVTACQLPGIPPSVREPECENVSATEWTIAGNIVTKVNDYYLYNAFWFIIVTSTSVGYGDITPTTSLGRTIAAMSALVGLVTIALLTGILSLLL
jgi:hypothetical protein